jgi:tRNA:m4X modification enzyme
VRGDAEVAVVMVAKHLCGVATDLALRSLLPLHQDATADSGSDDKSGNGSSIDPRAAIPAVTRGTRRSRSDGNLSTDAKATDAKAKISVDGVAIATCCHHCCFFGDYVAPEFFTDELGFSPAEFAMLTKWSSWATAFNACAHQNDGGDAAETAKVGVDVETKVGEHAPVLPPSATLSSKLLPDKSAQMEVGRFVKRLFDYGRLRFLQRLGYEGELVYYCSSDVSPENALLLAWKPRS